MQFSSRTPSNLERNQVAIAIERLRAEGRPIVDLTVSNPTRVGLDYPRDLLAPLADPSALIYEPSPLGLRSARVAIAADLERRAVAIDPGRVVLTASTSEAYSFLFKLLCDPGDDVLVPRPSYPLFDHLARLDAVALRPYWFEYHGRWVLDLDSVSAAIGPRTRAVLIVHPNNPTGSLLAQDERAALAGLCGDRSLALISDEVFAEYALVERKGPEPTLLANAEGLTFVLGGLSKSAGVPQAKLGWIAVNGPDVLVDAALERLELICDTYLSVSTPVQQAAGELLARGATIRGQILPRVRRNYRTLQEIGAAYPACSVLAADAGWYAVLKVPALQSEESLMLDLLQKDGVLVHPGYFFDFATEAFLVVSLLPEPGAFANAAGRVFARACAAI